MADGSTAPKPVIRAQEIRLGMLARWSHPEYAIMWEVGEATGAVQTKWADAVIMSCWPSRGLELHGVEIKISRGDWRREAMNPRKAEAIGKYCDRWWIHTAPGVIADVSELPPLWGWRVFDGKAWKTMKEAGLNPSPKPVTRQFLAALLRRADGVERQYIHERAQAMIEADRAGFEKRIADEVARRTERNDHAIKQVEQLEAALGIKLSQYHFSDDARQLGALMKVMQGCEPVTGWRGLVSLMTAAREIGDRIEDAIREAGVTAPEEIQAALAKATPKKTKRRSN